MKEVKGNRWRDHMVSLYSLLELMRGVPNYFRPIPLAHILSGKPEPSVVVVTQPWLPWKKAIIQIWHSLKPKNLSSRFSNKLWRKRFPWILLRYASLKQIARLLSTGPHNKLIRSSKHWNERVQFCCLTLKIFDLKWINSK